MSRQIQKLLSFTIIILTVLATTSFCVTIKESATPAQEFYTNDSSRSSNNSVLYEFESDVDSNTLPESHIVDGRSTERRQDDNFVLIDFLPDGEMERRISYNGIIAKETRAGNTR